MSYVSTRFAPIATSVRLVPQPTAVSCWSAALAMVAGTRDGIEYTPEAVARDAGMITTQRYEWGAIARAIETWHLERLGPAHRLPSDWAALIRAKGPIWIVATAAPDHAVVVTGLHGDGSRRGTMVSINNPWPPGRGALETTSFADFRADFGIGEGADAQMVAAAGLWR